MEHLNDPKIERDNEGWKGRLQLHIPLGKKTLYGKQVGMERFVMPGSNQLKNPSDHDSQVLKDHVKRHDESVADEWLQLDLGAGANASGSAAGAAAEEPLKKKRKRHLKTSKDRPKFHVSMKDAMDKLTARWLMKRRRRSPPCLERARGPEGGGPRPHGAL